MSHCLWNTLDEARALLSKKESYPKSATQTNLFGCLKKTSNCSVINEWRPRTTAQCFANVNHPTSRQSVKASLHSASAHPFKSKTRWNHQHNAVPQPKFCPLNSRPKEMLLSWNPCPFSCRIQNVHKNCIMHGGAQNRLGISWIHSQGGNLPTAAYPPKILADYCVYTLNPRRLAGNQRWFGYSLSSNITKSFLTQTF